MLAVQVVNYRTRTYLERCLSTVDTDLTRSGLEYEINLLENDSGESLYDLAAGFEHCRAFVAQKNLGFGAGHNLLGQQDPGPVHLDSNPDVELMLGTTTVCATRSCCADDEGERSEAGHS